MNYRAEDKKIIVEIPASNSGKFRLKTRSNNFGFGNSFAARSIVFNENVYLEWQIGYDATETDLRDEKKVTKLTNITFTGYNGKRKHPYELSELVYLAANIGLINTGSLAEIKEEIEGYEEYLSSKAIDVQQHGSMSLNGLTFTETSIRLPTFFLVNSDGTQVEISTQKQQYATGVQPMVYLSIPLGKFSNGTEFYNRVSERGDKLMYVVDSGNIDVLFSLLKVFGMASPAHNHDIKEIIKGLLSSLRQD